MATLLKGALIGFGQVAEKAHVPGFSAHGGFDLVAAADGSPARLNAARSALPQARLYSSLEELLEAEPGLDFVDIATPPFLHGRQALLALKRGCHVLCEKPLTLMPEELEAIRAAASAAQAAVFTVHNWAFSPQWLKVAELARSGALGEIRTVSLEVLRTRPASGALPDDWRRDLRQAGGGILVDHGWHNLYLLHRLLGDIVEPPRVERFSGEEGAAEEEVTLSLRFARAAARLHLTWRAKERANSASIEGSLGTLALSDDKLTVSSGDEAPRSLVFPEKLSAGSSHPLWFSAMLADFHNAVRDPKARSANLAEAAFCLKVIRESYARAEAAAP